MKKTGIFSGSFNPIHIGHLALANWILTYEELDEVWFLITPLNPLKNQEDMMDDTLRLEMVKAGINGYPAFKASDFEFHLPRPTYTIDTLRALENSYPDRSFHFIMGADNWASISRWKQYEELLLNYPVIIYPRIGYEINIPEKYSCAKAIDAPILDISSTFIRESFEKGKDVRFFLPENVRPYFIS